MALLTEESRECLLGDIILFVTEKLQDPNTEVKCSAIRVVNSISQNVNQSKN